MAFPKEAATRLMQAIVGNGRKAGDIVEDAHLRAAGLDEYDLRNGLLFAGDSGWIESGPSGYTRLTDAGFSVGRGVDA